MAPFGDSTTVLHPYIDMQLLFTAGLTWHMSYMKVTQKAYDHRKCNSHL